MQFNLTKTQNNFTLKKKSQSKFLEKRNQLNMNQIQIQYQPKIILKVLLRNYTKILNFQMIQIDHSMNSILQSWHLSGAVNLIWIMMSNQLQIVLNSLRNTIQIQTEKTKLKGLKQIHLDLVLNTQEISMIGMTILTNGGDPL